MAQIRKLATAFLPVLLVVAGCAATKSPIHDPEIIVNQVLADCKAGNYEAAADHFESGPARWKEQPDWVRDFVDRICTNGRAHSFEVHERVPKGDRTVALHLTTYKDPGHEEGLRTMTWWFELQGNRWVVTKVE